MKAAEKSKVDAVEYLIAIKAKLDISNHVIICKRIINKCELIFVHIVQKHCPYDRK